MRNFLNSTTFLAILACWLWSTAFVGVKIGLQYQSPFQFAGLRFLIAGLLLLVYFGKPKRFYNEVRSRFGYVVLISFIQIFFQYALFYMGLSLVPGALGAIIIGSSPLFIATVAHFTLKTDRMTYGKLVGILLGVVGIVVITIGRSTFELAGGLELIGIGLLILNNLSSGFANVLIQKKSGLVSPIVLSSSSLIIGGLMLLLLSIPVEGINLETYPLEYYLSLGWLSFLSAAAFTIWFGLIKRDGVKVSELNLWKFIIPVSGAILSWVLLADENPDLFSIIGMFIIAGSLLVLNRLSKR